MTESRIAIGADHGGFALKERLKTYIQSLGYEVVDCGTDSTDPVDYPVIAYKVATLVGQGDCRQGVIIDGAGIGSAMAANKVKGVRAALCYDLSTARNSREHNDANVLTLGAGLIGAGLAEQIVGLWLGAQCTEDRHLRRVGIINDIERGVVSPDPVKVESMPEISQEPKKDLSSAEIESIVDRMDSLLTEQLGISLSELSSLTQLKLMDGRDVGVEKSPGTMQEFISMGVGRMTSGLGNGKHVPKDIARYIDHTLLRPDATEDDIHKLCNEALRHEFATVCVNPTYVKLAAHILRGSPVKVCGVVGFPFGSHSPEIKGMEARQSVRDGAKEIDMVINIGALKSQKEDLLFRDIRAVAEACEDGRAVSKVIIETALLTDDEKILACQVARRARADFVKTSTGFAGGGATAHDVALMSAAVSGTQMGVKASGGIRSYADAKKMIRAGATRIGASAGIQIVKEATAVTES